MDGHILRGKIIIILVIGVKVLHLFGVERDLEDPAVPLDLEIAVVRPGVDPGGEGKIHSEAYQKFFGLFSFMVRVVICLRLCDCDLHLFHIGKSGEGQELQ